MKWRRLSPADMWGYFAHQAVRKSNWRSWSEDMLDLWHTTYMGSLSQSPHVGLACRLVLYHIRAPSSGSGVETPDSPSSTSAFRFSQRPKHHRIRKCLGRLVVRHYPRQSVTDCKDLIFRSARLKKPPQRAEPLILAA